MVHFLLFRLLLRADVDPIIDKVLRLTTTLGPNSSLRVALSAGNSIYDFKTRKKREERVEEDEMSVVHGRAIKL